MGALSRARVIKGLVWAPESDSCQGTETCQRLSRIPINDRNHEGREGMHVGGFVRTPDQSRQMAPLLIGNPIKAPTWLTSIMKVL